jgi:hypothetical protein
MGKPERPLRHAVVANLVQAGLCFVAYALRKAGLDGNTVVQAVMLVSDLVAWFLVSAGAALARNDDNIEGGAMFGISALAPILALVLAATAADRMLGASASWALFVLLGAAINFYMRPMALMARVTAGNGYIIYLLDITVLMLVSIFSYAYASKFNRLGAKKRRG